MIFIPASPIALGFFKAKWPLSPIWLALKGPNAPSGPRGSGGQGLRWVEGAGDHVAAPTFLSNRFEIAFLTNQMGKIV